MRTSKKHFQVRSIGACLLMLCLLLRPLQPVDSHTAPVDDNDEERTSEQAHIVPRKITDGLYLGSYATASDKTALKSLNITHVLTVAHSLPPFHPDDLIYKFIQVDDSPSVKLSQYIDECFKFIDDARASGGSVLIQYCLAGISRSATVTVAYMMSRYGMCLGEAFLHVLKRRPVIYPNASFWLQLREYERYLQRRDEL